MAPKKQVWKQLSSIDLKDLTDIVLETIPPEDISMKDQYLADETSSLSYQRGTYVVSMSQESISIQDKFGHNLLKARQYGDAGVKIFPCDIIKYDTQKIYERAVELNLEKRTYA